MKPWSDMVSVIFGNVIHCFREREPQKISCRTSRSWAMSVEKAEADFWSALSLLYFETQTTTNIMLRSFSDFSKMSQIPESIVREKLNKAVRSKELH